MQHSAIPSYKSALPSPLHKNDSAPSSPKETAFPSPVVSRTNSLTGATLAEGELRRYEEEHNGFGQKRETLVAALDSTTALVKSLQAFNQEKWTIHYPHQLGFASTSARSSSVPPTSRSPTKGSSRVPTLRRSASMTQDDSVSSDGDSTDGEGSTGSIRRPRMGLRAYSMESSPSKGGSSTPTQLTSPHPLSILALDLKLGHNVAPSAALPALLPTLSLSTLSQLLSRRLTSSLAHISSLRTRVTDTSSRILVTGDLNAGKSTLVNAILRRDIMPSDQQPCTTVFCEVLDAASYNGGQEEIHAIKDLELYDASNAETFDLYTLEQVNEVQDTGDKYQLVKAYVTDARSPVDTESTNPSFIKNGLVSISLIDAPGLNRDTLSTTALFARQSEIDVIVFVVSAENHFTLSAKEFLWNASREKAFVFIVVNKWAAIKDKARCMRVVGEQIQQLSPATWEARSELVHFVDAAEVMGETEGTDDAGASSFDHLEASLRSFVLLKRAQSKLAPAQHYLLNLLSDLATLAHTNVTAASDDLSQAQSQLERVKPIHERLAAQRDEVEEGVDKVEESVVDTVRSNTWSRLERALGYVSEGQVVPTLVPDTPRASLGGADMLAAPTTLPAYPGILGLWSWASEVKHTLVQALEAEVRCAEDEARGSTVEGVKRVMTDLGDKYLPGEAEEKHERVFRPEVMFAKRRRGLGKLASRGVSTGLGLGAVGIGSGWSASEFEVSLFDLFDLERITSVGGLRKKAVAIEDDTLETGALVSLGLGSIGMIGSRMIGVKGTVESIARVFDMLGSKQARQWAAPVVAVLTVGLAVFIVIDLPRAVPRNIGRKLQSSLSSPLTSSPTSPPTSFSTAHSDRIARETRKVLRLAGWDLRERFRSALEKSANERKEVEATVDKAEHALTWLGDFLVKVVDEDDRVEALVL